MKLVDYAVNPYRKVLSEIAEALRSAILSSGYAAAADMQEISKSLSLSKLLGDISSSIAFKIGFSSNVPPQKAAEGIVSKLRYPDIVEKVSADGGFINFYLNKKEFSKAVLSYALEAMQRAANNGKGKGKRVIVEYPSVNPNKPWHVGHLRNALLGNSIANIYEYLGYDVKREDYIDDLGVQVMESLWGYINLGKTPTKKFDHWLGEEYVEVNKKLAEKEVAESIKALSISAEKGDTNEAKMLMELTQKCVMAQYDTAFSYHIYHDVMVFESDIVSEGLLARAMEILEKANVIEKPTEGKYAGCVVVNFEKLSSVPKSLQDLKESAKVLIKSDGTATYVAKDIAFHMWKFGMLEDTFKYINFINQPGGKVLYSTSRSQSAKRFDKPMFNHAGIAINVIDVRQSYPQAVLRLVFDAIGRKDIAEGIVHLAYGEVELQGATLSGRSGTWIGYSADDLLAEARKKAQTLITERFKLSGTEKDAVADSVARAAIIFEFLKVSPEKKVIFSWERALNFEGNSGPYVQYMHARASRLLEAAGSELTQLNESALNAVNYNFDAIQEFSLIKQIAVLEEVAEKSGNELRPNLLVDYVNGIASAFSTFYESLPVLKAASRDERIARLAITKAAEYAIRKVLELLSIEAVEKM